MSHSNESSNSNYPIYDNYVLQTQNQQKYDRRSPRGTLHHVLNSPDLAEVHIQSQSVKVGRSPNLFESSPNSTGSIDYTSLCSSDNIVVYDDIGRNWLNLNKTSDEQENIIDYNISPKRCTGNTLDSNAAMESFDNHSKTRFATATSPVRKPGFPKRITLPSSNYDSQHAITDTTTANTPSHVFSDEISKESTLDYLYEFSETRKVLEDFFSEPAIDPILDDSDSECDKSSDNAYIGQRLASLAHLSNNQYSMNESPKQRSGYYDMELYLDSNSSGDVLSKESLPAMNRQKATNNATLSPDSIEHDSNSGDLDSLPNDINCTVDQSSLFSGMPVLEDGLSSGHASDTDVHTNDMNCAEYQDINKADDTLEEQKIGPFDDEVAENNSVESTLRDIHSTLQRTKILLEISNPRNSTKNSDNPPSPNVWVRRDSINTPDSINSDQNPSRPCPDDEEADTDLETDRLLGQQRLDNIGNLEKVRFTDETTAIPRPAPQFSSATLRQGIGTSLTSASPVASHPDGMQDNDFISPIKMMAQKSPSGSTSSNVDGNRKRNKEVRWEPAVLIEGVLFRAKYLGSTQLVCEGQPTKSTRMMQAEEAVSRIKALAPDGESQPSTEVDLFISTEKIMVLNTDLKEIMMDHALRTISYIADIGDLVVLMARRRYVPNGNNDESSPDTPKPNRTPKMICHVFMSEEAQFIAQSIGQAFQVAYMEFLKANGIEDHSFVKEMDYQEVLNSQEIFGDELEIFAKKELQKEVVVPKAKGEILGVVIVESGWGSMLPTVVIANLLSSGAAARCGQLNIGDQIIAINGMSLVGLPLTLCQSYIRNTKSQTAVKFTVVPCPPVVEVKIKRPNTKYQLGFSVQNGVICSLLRGGIAERGGVRVGHRIIEINNQSVVAVPHEKIVSLLATSVGEILMKTMPTSMFRLLTGQESPLYI
ncbi:amyloid-beta A4 precursor protein-binding family A member 2-like isoform X4 [Bradysia coprophila]|uniref:amyloid-beta A4 precursor protein-binding family A member 2-like isoform X4 n=1 Tax=Bradysia coprophila TaxID=38358 RepID=UPI00187DB87B|nr:amyloid-beta A4 precursor protein-binding family A member 2-like isoform X4 [Bradysia coprophila]